MALDYNTVQASLDVQNIDLTKENKARTADSNVISMVALLSDCVEDAQTTGKKKAKNAPNALGASAPSNAAPTGKTTSRKASMIELSKLLSTVMSMLIKTSEAMQNINNDIDKSAIDGAKANLKDAQAADKKNAEAEQKQKAAKAWGIFATIAAAVIGVLITVLTGGSATAIAVAVVIALVMTVVSVTGALSAMTTAIASALEKAGCSKEVAKILATIITIVVVVIATVLGGAGLSALVDGLTSSLVGTATAVGDEVATATTDAIATDISQEVADEVGETATKALTKGLTKALSKLSATAAKDVSEIESTVSDQVDEMVSTVLKKTGTDLSDAASSIKSEVSEALNNALTDNTKSQVINGLKGIKAATFGAIKGGVAGTGLALSEASELTGDIMDVVYKNDKDKEPEWVKTMVDVIAAVLTIVTTLMGEGALGNAGGAAKGAISDLGPKLANWVENNMSSLTKAQAIIQGIVGAGGAAAGAEGAVATNDQAQAEKESYDYQATNDLLQYVLNQTGDNMTSDRQTLEKAMSKLTTEINAVVNSMGKESDFVANALSAS